MIILYSLSVIYNLLKQYFRPYSRLVDHFCKQLLRTIELSTCSVVLYPKCKVGAQSGLA